ncbi:preprotein translocase subunit SecG [Ruminococcaceae bacterium OttesenSCG-928-A16]|nr:preprotein translocase subunit SecG [Ruminococcaceae bacterium OttesenSCG-928-A16]
MSVWEIISGVILILSCIVIVAIVLVQEPKGQGLSSVITGGTEMMSGESRNRSKEVRQVKFTRNAAIIFFVFTVLVNILSVLVK